MLRLRATELAALLMMMTMTTVIAFGGNEERFIKKYAMMKIYESCFGPEVVKQIRKEMKAACLKCASYEPPPTMAASEDSEIPPEAGGPQRPSAVSNKVDGPIMDSQNALFANTQTFDVDKLNQAILAYRPNNYQVPLFRPYTQPTSMPGMYSGYPNPTQVYYPPSMYQQQPSPYGSPYLFPFFGQQLSYRHQRNSRDMDIRGQLEALTSRMSGRVKNVTCVMQELGYLDDNLEPNFVKIRERISSLPVADDLRNDMQEGVAFCEQFSQCVPPINKDKSPLSRELIRPMFFFKCYKHKKLEACIMKDVREKYSGISDEEFDSEMELRRNGKAMKFDKSDIDELAVSIYDFLYGTDSGVELESFF